MYLLDTDTCSALIAGDKKVIERKDLLGPANWAISSITAMELTYGASLSKISLNKKRLVFEFLETAPVFPFDRVAGLEAGRIRALLQEAGRPTGGYDLLIAGHALSKNLILITGNSRHFSHIPGLMVDNWIGGRD